MNTTPGLLGCDAVCQVPLGTRQMVSRFYCFFDASSLYCRRGADTPRTPLPEMSVDEEMEDSVEETMNDDVLPRRLAQSSSASRPLPPSEGHVDIPASVIKRQKEKYEYLM